MSAPVAFIAAPGVLTQASDAVKSATTNSLQRAACVVPNARQKLTQDHIKTTRHTLSQEEGSFDSQDRCKIANAGEPSQGAIYLQN
jgi:hypothetical protein